MCKWDLLRARATASVLTTITSTGVNSEKQLPRNAARVGLVIGVPSAGNVEAFLAGGNQARSLFVVPSTNFEPLVLSIQEYGQLMMDTITIVLSDAAATVDVYELTLPARGDDVDGEIERWNR